MRKKTATKLAHLNKVRAATYLDNDIWQQIQSEAEAQMTTESHIMRLLLSEALKARAEK